METLKLSYVGTFWGASGTLFHMTDADNNQARVYVDSVGETWVDIRRIPEGGYFHSERVEAFRALNGAARAEADLRDRGFSNKRMDRYAHRVHERGL